MRVVNNKVTIGRGETATYTLNVKYYQENNPFVLTAITGDESDVDAIAVFTVKETLHDSTTPIDPIIIQLRTNGEGYKIFATSELNTEIRDNGNTFAQVAADATKYEAGCMFVDKDNKYKYVIQTGVDTYAWSDDYSFVLDFPLIHEWTAVLEPKRYVYDVNILYGNWSGSTDDINNFTITGKQILIAPTDFIVEASLSG